MKKILVTILLSVISTIANAEIRFSGYIITEKGDTIWADEIKTDDDDIWDVKVIYEGQSIQSTINEDEVEKITIVKKDSCYPDRAIVYLTDGRNFELDNPSLFGIFSGYKKEGWIGFNKYDPISKELKQNKMYCGNISEIQIDKNKGELKVDSKGNRFPPHYMFSPFTGEKLSFGAYNSKK